MWSASRVAKAIFWLFPSILVVTWAVAAKRIYDSIQFDAAAGSAAAVSAESTIDLCETHIRVVIGLWVAAKVLTLAHTALLRQIYRYRYQSNPPDPSQNDGLGENAGLKFGNVGQILGGIGDVLITESRNVSLGSGMSPEQYALFRKIGSVRALSPSFRSFFLIYIPFVLLPFVASLMVVRSVLEG